MALKPSADSAQPRLVALAGGVGGARLAHGLAAWLDPDHLSIVVNTGDDFEHLGLLICPDLDTVLYNLAGVYHPEQGWGRADESFHVLDEAARLGHEPWFRLGDKDLALHLLRREQLVAGRRLTAITADLAQRFGVRHPILPMSDDPVRTIVCTTEGDLAFQDYFVRRRCRPHMVGMRLEGLETAQPTPDVLTAIAQADAVVICPSNPYVSIGPILALPGLREQIAARPTVAVSPIVGGQALKGPAAKMMAELGAEVSALGVARHYADLLRGFVLDQRDASLAPAIADLGLRVCVTDTIMNDVPARIRLGAEVLRFVQEFFVETK